MLIEDCDIGSEGLLMNNLFFSSFSLSLKVTDPLSLSFSLHPSCFLSLSASSACLSFLLFPFLPSLLLSLLEF